MQLSNKTGLVLKISLVLFVLLGLVVYKLNDYFREDKLSSTRLQLHNRVALEKTTVSSQLAQLRNVLSGLETGINESQINWVQLDPFFAVLKIGRQGDNLHVESWLGRSGTVAERWNNSYLEQALKINQAKGASSILSQLFQDKAGQKYLVLRFQVSPGEELAVVGAADYFQKFFDLERGGKSTSLLITQDDLLVAHTEGDYIATLSEESHLSSRKYLIEKEEISGTNMLAVNYVLKNKIAAAFSLPFSIVGVVVGVGCILLALLFYIIDPLERRVERYKKQEREQIYKDTFGAMSSGLTAQAVGVTSSVPRVQVKLDTSVVAPVVRKPVDPIVEEEKTVSTNVADEEVTHPSVELSEINSEEEKTVTNAIQLPDLIEENKNILDQTLAGRSSGEGFIALEENVDLAEIEKALALDEFDSEPADKPGTAASSDLIEKNLTPQKISLSSAGGHGGEIDRPDFKIARKAFAVDEMKIAIRRPEKS